MGQTAGMQEAFGVVIFVVVIVAALIAVATLASARSAWDHVGAGGLADGTDRPASEPVGGAASTALRDEEVRQMLRARNVRRRARGREPVDVEAELTRLLAAPGPPADHQLAAEVRDLIRARNHRRVKRGEEPLDVETEVARRLAEPG